MRIRLERQKKRWSQETLAAESRMDRAYISDIELGLRRFSVIHLARIAKALGVRVGDLFPE